MTDGLATKEDIRSLERFIVDLKESLEREIHGLTARFDAQSARLDRHAALWQTGSRWSSRMDAWAEKVDGNADAQAKLLAELMTRVQQLEKRLEDR